MDLHHKVYGSGDIVVILHGLFGMSDNWKTIARRLSDSYSVVIVDLPNHGRSPRLETFDLEDVVETLYQFLTDHWMYEIRLVGHSLGAKVAMRMAQHYPDIIEQLVSVDMGPQAYPPGHQLIFDALNSIDLNSLSSRSAADKILSTYIDEESTRLFLLKNLRRLDNGFEWKFDLPVLQRDYLQITKPIDPEIIFDKSTLFVRGDQSDYLNYEEDSKLIHSIFPTAKLESIEQAGHWVHADQPDALEKMLRSFFEEIN